MTYDLVVFSPLRKLRNRSKFLAWLESRTRWVDELDYNDPSHAAKALQAWYWDMIELFPPRYGHHRVSESTAGKGFIADYGIAPDLIHVSFEPARAELAYQTVHRLAARHALGFFDIRRGEAWFPGPRKTLEIAHQGPKISGLDGPHTAAAFGARPEPDIATVTAPEAARSAGAATMPAPDLP